MASRGVCSVEWFMQGWPLTDLPVKLWSYKTLSAFHARHRGEFVSMALLADASPEHADDRGQGDSLDQLLALDNVPATTAARRRLVRQCLGDIYGVSHVLATTKQYQRLGSAVAQITIDVFASHRQTELHRVKSKIASGLKLQRQRLVVRTHVCVCVCVCVCLCVCLCVSVCCIVVPPSAQVVWCLEQATMLRATSIVNHGPFKGITAAAVVRALTHYAKQFMQDTQGGRRITMKEALPKFVYAVRSCAGRWCWLCGVLT